MRIKQPYIERQVNITKDGFNVQTDIETFWSYYKRLGWHVVDNAPAFPGFKAVASTAGYYVPDTEIQVAEMNVQQARLF